MAPVVIIKENQPVFLNASNENFNGGGGGYYRSTNKLADVAIFIIYQSTVPKILEHYRNINDISRAHARFQNICGDTFTPCNNIRSHIIAKCIYLKWTYTTILNNKYYLVYY